MRRVPLIGVGWLGAMVVLFALSGPAAAERPHVTAYGTITRSHGGTIRARDGAALYVPPGALNERRARAEIKALGHKKFSIAILGPWNGRVRVTLPNPGHGWHPLVLHELRGKWHLASRALGQMTLWVTHLSDFASGVIETCDQLQGDGPEAYDTCLAVGGIGVLTVGAYQGISHLLKGPPPVAPGPSPACPCDLPVSQSPPVTIQGSSPNLQGGSNPQSGETNGGSPEAGGSSGGGESPPPPPPPPPSQAIQIGWSGAHPTWIWMTLSGFAPGSYAYTCDFASGGDATYTLVETVSPETWDNGHTCFDEEPGDQVWVTISGVSSNVLTVP